MTVLQDINIFHDWYMDGVSIKDTSLELLLRLDKKKKLMCFNEVTRCLISSFMIQNIIYEVHILDKDIFSERYKEYIKILDSTYSAPPSPKHIAIVTPSVGAEAIVEFSDVQIQNLT